MRDFVSEFVDRYRDRAADPFLGDSAEARVMTKLLNELEREYVAFLDAEVSGAQAAAESGYTRQAIASMRSNGIIGKRRGDLPRKPGFGVAPTRPALHDADSDLADQVLAARQRIGLKVG